MAEHDEIYEVGPTYKSLFLGACLILGSTFGWWITNFVSSVESLHVKYDRRLAELETKALRETWELEALRAEMDDLKRKERGSR